ncbi:glycosyltransferase [Mucilaginibacter sp. HMF5004]|uniref:glycosyltransferase family 2 protein n=1 Tax=Mucilaginibacter rivuli TaxID=2857527 RepID=UPI001C5F4134|nr:glycosyltransferase family 2 protein [Mucilaginibacter rivuli]MBW4890096.1 glycosyltransferase [Mucilaginibacter rivuli]
MKISVVTVVYNNAATIKDAITSVLAQDYANVEYIVIDGGSTDGTIDIIKSFGDKINIFVSEKDKGLYDAMNKGIKLATGDVVGTLNSDDFFYDSRVLTNIAKAFVNESIDAVIGDIVFIKDGDENKVLRKYSSAKWQPSRFAWGYMPAHPSFFAKKYLFTSFGYYKTDYRIASDYELLIRFLFMNKINWKYIPLITTKMRPGGASTQGIKSILILNKEIARACRDNGIYSNYLMIYSKYIFKPFEFIFK